LAAASVNFSEWGRSRSTFQLAAYGNVAKPEFGPDWQLCFQIQFLFPM